MKEHEKKKNKYDIHMTDEEKNRVWDGVLRRASDFPDGKSPFAHKPSNWDGTLRRTSDFPGEKAADHSDDKKEDDDSSEEQK